MLKIIIAVIVIAVILNLKQAITGVTGAVLVAFAIIASFFVYTLVYHGDAFKFMDVPDSYQDKQDKIEEMYQEDIKYVEME